MELEDCEAYSFCFVVGVGALDELLRFNNLVA
jgi:hypothetical protein